MISGSNSPGHKKLLLLIFMLKSHETGLTLPHVYEEIKGDMRKMQMRQQPETIKEKNFKKRSPCSLQQWAQTHTPKRTLNIPIKNVVNKFDKHHKHTIIIKYMPVLSQKSKPDLIFYFIFVLCRTRFFTWALLGLVTVLWCWSIHIQVGFFSLLSVRWSL